MAGVIVNLVGALEGLSRLCWGFFCARALWGIGAWSMLCLQMQWRFSGACGACWMHWENQKRISAWAVAVNCALPLVLRMFQNGFHPTWVVIQRSLWLHTFDFLKNSCPYLKLRTEMQKIQNSLEKSPSYGGNFLIQRKRYMKMLTGQTGSYTRKR